MRMQKITVRFIGLGLIWLSAATIALGQPSNEIKRVTDIVNSSQPKTSQERSELTEQIIQALGPYAETDSDIRALIRTLEIESDLMRFETDSMAGSTSRAVNANDAEERVRNLNILRAMLLDRAATVIETLARSNMSVEDAKRISEIAKYASQALDDINDPSILGGASSAYTKLLTRLDGVASLAQAVQNPEARSILSGLRGTIGTIDKKLQDLGVSAGNPMKAFDIPAEIVGAIVDTSARGMDETTEALKDITKAMGGDAEALKRLPGHSQRIERTLSPKTYGQAMLKAMADRVIDRIPFARTLAKLFASPASGEPASPVSAKAKVINLDWWSSASGSEINENDVYRCEPNPTNKGSRFLTGTHRYAVISAICWAAVHTGAITAEAGGRFQLRYFPFDENFEARGSTLNGVTSDGYNWNSLKKGTYVIIKIDQ